MRVMLVGGEGRTLPADEALRLISIGLAVPVGILSHMGRERAARHAPEER